MQVSLLHLYKLSHEDVDESVVEQVSLFQAGGRSLRLVKPKNGYFSDCWGYLVFCSGFVASKETFWTSRSCPPPTSDVYSNITRIKSTWPTTNGPVCCSENHPSLIRQNNKYFISSAPPPPSLPQLWLNLPAEPREPEYYGSAVCWHGHDRNSEVMSAFVESKRDK